MNSRIDSLIEQCTIQQFSDCVGGYETFDRERFAELIVQECIGKIELEAAQYAEPVWAIELTNDIREHFGIEP